MKLKSLIAEVLGVSLESLHESTEIRGLPSWDSMNHIILITRLEEVFEIQLTGDEIADLKTVGDARKFLRGHGAEV